MDNIITPFEMYRFFTQGGQFVFNDTRGKTWILRDDVGGYTIGPVGHPGEVQKFEGIQSALIAVLNLVGTFKTLGK